MQIENQILFELAERVCSPLGLVVVDTRMTQKGSKRVLEVTIHRPGSHVSLDDCEVVSRQLDTALDETLPQGGAGPYLLEVASPGLDRKLSTDREFELFLGCPVKLRTRKKVEPFGISIDGYLAQKTDESITLTAPRPTESAGAKPSRSARKKESDISSYPGSLIVELQNVLDICLRPGEIKLEDKAPQQI